MSREKPVAIVVPHTHWDREWRYPIWRTRALLVEFMDQLLDVLEQDEAYRCFVLDGQCVAVEDYLAVRSEHRERIATLVRAGRLKIGPWYTLPDLYPLDGECLLRNLLKGIRFAEQFGGHLGVGYNSFGWGQTAQFPQIYSEFGFDFLIAAKNVDVRRAPHCEFWWQGPDGTRMLTSRLGQDGRANGFFQAYLPIRFGMAYRSDEYRYRWSQGGQVIHRADADAAPEDYFRLGAPDGYHADQVRDGFDAAWRAADDTLAPDYRLILVGSDFTGALPALTRMVRDANAALPDRQFVLGTLEDYAAGLHRRLADAEVPVVSGELRDGPASHCSANALAVRIPIKQLNKRAENVLLRQAEPLASLTAMLGQEYPAEMLDRAWRYMLQSHPHDSINGVTQDKTADDTTYRLNQALEIGQVVRDQAVGQLARRIDVSGFDPDDALLLIVNPLPRPVRTVLKLCIDTPREQNVWEVGLQDASGRPIPVQQSGRSEGKCPVHDAEARPWPFEFDRHTIHADPGELPAGGYTVLKVAPRRRFERGTEWWPPMRTSTGDEIARTPHTLENEHLRVDVNSDGTFDLIDKSHGRTIRGAHWFEDSGDVGDYWAFYPPDHNQVISSCGSAATIALEDNGPLSATTVVRIELPVPARAIVTPPRGSGESRRSDQTAPVTITSRLTLKRGSKRLDVRTTIDNTARDHRLRVMLPTDVKTDHTDAAGHFHVDRRSIYPLKDEQGAFYPEMQTAPMQMFADVSDGAHGLAVISNSLTEHQLLDDDRRTLALTLFRAVRNRICTEFRSTGDFPDQAGGQLLRTLTFDYALMPHDGDWRAGGVYDQALALNAPTVTYQISAGQDGTLPPMQSLWRVEPADLIVSALKRAEDRDTFIMRLFNPTDEPVAGRVTLPVTIAAAHRTDLNERRVEALVTSGREVSVHVDPYKIVTIEMEP